ncbi:hypothetical protein ACT6QE_06455, partial [Staphylococcus aureus]
LLFILLGSVYVSIFHINRVLCPSYQGFRIYRETLSRFSCAASVFVNPLKTTSLTLAGKPELKAFAFCDT